MRALHLTGQTHYRLSPNPYNDRRENKSVFWSVMFSLFCYWSFSVAKVKLSLPTTSPLGETSLIKRTSLSRITSLTCEGIHSLGLSHLGITNKKRQKHCNKTVFLSFLFANLRKLRLKTYGFLRLIKVFYLFPFSPSDVFIYASRSKNENFCSKSVNPKVLFSLRIRWSYNSYSPFCHFTLIYLNS